jgi:hypothetical protein
MNDGSTVPFMWLVTMIFFSHALILSVAYGEKETRKEDIPQGLWRMNFICDIVESIDLA